MHASTRGARQTLCWVTDLDMRVNICAQFVEIKWARFSCGTVRHLTPVNGANEAAHTVDDVTQRVGKLDVVPTQPHNRRLDNVHQL